MAAAMQRLIGENVPIARSLLLGNDVRRGRATVEAARQRCGSASIGRILRDLSFGITSSATKQSCYVDLKVEDFLFIFDALLDVAAATGQIVHRLKNNGEWTSLDRLRAKPWMRKRNRGGFVELAVTDREDKLLDRISLVLWDVGEEGHWVTHAANVPVKRCLSLAATDLPTDAFSEPVDAVFTWVNSTDPDWLGLFRKHGGANDFDPDRFSQNEELKYAIRSVRLLAPWIRNIYIVSNCNPPAWFKATDNTLWVDHSEIIPEQYLPLFNSRAIETFVHNIPALSEKFLYLNDDFYICSPVVYSDFFSPHGLTVARLESGGAVPFFHSKSLAGSADSWQAATANGARLVADRFGSWPSRIHTHSPYAISKVAFARVLELFSEHREATRKARFRSFSDVSFISFVYHHSALNEHLAAPAYGGSMTVNNRNYRSFEKRRQWNELKFFCLNDGGGSSIDHGYNRFKHSFPALLYPFRLRSER